MARTRVTNYTFTPGAANAGTVKIMGRIPLNQILMIVNNTRNDVIFNFGDTARGTFAYSYSATEQLANVDSNNDGVTTLTLKYNTSGYSASDVLAVYVDDKKDALKIYPADAYMDPVEKMRVSTPQSLIDTDFEYGVQQTKWENLTMLNGRACSFYDVSAPLTITNITAVAATKVVTVSTTNPPAVGTPVFIFGTRDVANVDGWWVVETIVAGSNFTFTVTNTPSTTLYDAQKTYVYSSSFYTGSAIPAATNAITLNGTTGTVTTTNAHGLQVGNGFYIVGTTGAAGPLQVRTTYGTYTGTSGAASAGAKTNVVQKATSGTGSGATFNLTIGANSTAYSTTITGLTFSAAGTGYKVGDTITLGGANLGGVDVTNDFTFTLGTVTFALNSSWTVATTPTNNSFTFACTGTGTITAILNSSVYPRQLGYTEHRPFDGGVQFSNVSPYQGYQVIRQTRRYFRYQSGKGIQFSTGSILKPPLNVDTITSSGTTVTVTCKFPHGLMPGATVKVAGAVETAYNGTFTVVSAPTGTTFTYTALTTPSATPATGFPITVGADGWYGSSNRVGMFDHQNGFYFEFDGQTVWAVRRSSTLQLSGTAVATVSSASVTGTGTKFSSQLKPGDWIVIRGMSYLVQTITSDTQMYIYPEFRGATTSAAIISKTVNTRWPQSNWNLDKANGTGPSGFTLDLSKMQMFFMDYAWYGAGVIRYGFRGAGGDIIYVHKVPNNNVNTEAYMRSGNLPARYETNTIPPYTYLTATLAAATTTGGTIAVADTTGWPNSGTVLVTAAGATGAVIEYITYSAKTATTLTIAARAQTGGQAAAQTFTYSATAPIQVELFSPQCATTISHWGSSVIMDGRFDDDKSFLFNYGMNAPSTFATAGTRYPVFSIRLSPSVDNGLTGLLGAREIINRMQLTPASVGVYTTTAGVKVELILNGRVSTGTFAPVGGSSLAQYANHGTTATIAGGEAIYTFFVAANNTNSQDLSKVRDIGNSILGGGTSLTAPNTVANIYPDGPDIITVCVTPLVANAAVAARLNWTEAQA